MRCLWLVLGETCARHDAPRAAGGAATRCLVCLGAFKSSSQPFRCRCRAVLHVSCRALAGACPSCKEA